MPFPLIPIGIGILGTLAAGLGLKALLGSDDDKPSQSKPKIAFFGQVGAGKTTICEILSQGTFKEEYEATPKKRIYPLRGYNAELWDTAGSFDEQNLKIKRDLAPDDTSIYVLNMKDYVGAKTEELTREIITYVKGGGNKIIGTHKDEVRGYDAKIANEIRQTFHVKCEIWDLTQAKTQGKELGKQLLSFICQ